VYNAVGCVVVRGGDLGAVDKDGAARGPDRHVLALHGFQHLHVHEVLGVHGGGGHVVGEDVDELRLVLGLEQVGEDALGESVERFVGRGKDGERTLARESVDEIGGLERCDQGRELRSGDGEVHDGFAGGLWGVAGHEDRVDDVYNAVGCVVVRGGDLGAVDEDATPHPSNDRFSLHRGDHFHVGEILGVHITRCHVIGEDVDELRLVLGLEQVGEDARGESVERFVGRGEDSERTLARQSVDEVGGLERCDEGGELRSGDGEVHNGFAGRLRHEHPATIAKRMGRIQRIVQVTFTLRRVYRSAAPAFTVAKAAASALGDSDVLVEVSAHSGVMLNWTC